MGDQLLIDQLTERLRELRQEYAAGQAAIAELDVKAADLRATMLRISGAIQVLEELLSDTDAAPSG